MGDRNRGVVTYRLQVAEASAASGWLLAVWTLENLGLEAVAEVGFLGCQWVVGAADAGGFGPDRQAVVRGGVGEVSAHEVRERLRCDSQW